MNPKHLLSLVITVMLFSVPCDSGAQDHEIIKSIQQLAGEDYLYSMDFLFFNRLATGELRFAATGRPNIYRAELVGRTLGIAAWLAGDRTQRYSSLMELMPGGYLRSIEHEAQIVRSRWGEQSNWRRYYRYDYELGRIFAEKSKQGVVRSKKQYAIPEGQFPVDMLTAFYNLRAGVYGPLARGTQLLLPTFSGKDFSEIIVSVLTQAQQESKSYFPAHGLLIQVIVDPEIFDTGSGKLFLWFNDSGLPERGIVEDLIGLGDIRGYLDEESL